MYGRKIIVKLSCLLYKTVHNYFNYINILDIKYDLGYENIIMFYKQTKKKKKMLEGLTMLSSEM